MPGEYHGHIHMGAGASHHQRDFETVDGGKSPGHDVMRTLRRLNATSVTVVTTTTDRGFRGIAVSAFTIVSLDPPRLLICLDHRGEAIADLTRTGIFAVSVLSDTQEFLAERFAGRAPLVNPRFDGVKHQLVASGLPVLEECLVWFDCRVETRQEHGDHAVVFGAVQSAGFGTGTEPLLYFDGGYRFLNVI